MKSWHKGWRRRWCKLTVAEKVVSRKISYNVVISHIICLYLYLLFRRYCLSRFNLIWYVLPTSVVQNNGDTRPDDEIPKECLNSLKAKGPWMKIQQFWRQVHSTFIGLIWSGWHCLEYVEYYKALIPATQVAPAHVNVVLLLQTDWLDIRSPELILMLPGRGLPIVCLDGLGPWWLVMKATALKLTNTVIRQGRQHSWHGSRTMIVKHTGRVGENGLTVCLYNFVHTVPTAQYQRT